jgi:hypothetical protein
MPVTTVSTITEVFDGLERQLAGNNLSLGPICTRVMLRTGVNLKDPRYDQNTDAALVAKVLAALADMGHAL